MRMFWGEPHSTWIHGSKGCWRDLFDGASSLSVPKGTMLYKQGDRADYVYCVERGRLRVSSTHHNGSEKQVYIAEYMSICCETECISSLPLDAAATAIVNSTVLALPKGAFLERIGSDVELANILLSYEARKCSMLQNQAMLLTCDSARTRIILTLLDLCQTYGRETPMGTLIDVRFTKNELAGLVGTSRVTASNILMDLRRSGHLREYRGRTVVPDEERLLDLLYES